MFRRMIASLFIVFFAGLAVFCCFSACSANEGLTGNDLIAYNLMLEVCKVAKDPTDTFIISGTVTEGDTGGSIKVQSGGQISYVIVTYENGMAICSNGEEAANYSDIYMRMFTNTDCFDAEKVNQALKNHWRND